MTIGDFFKEITKKYCPSLTEGVYTAENLIDFYNDCVEKTLPKVEFVKAWHELLKSYIKDPEAVFFVRRYSSTKDKDGKWDIRRGFMTVYDNIKYVFVDNFFAQYFYAMAINEFVPEYNDFKQFIIDRRIPYGYSAVSSERDHQAYPQGHTYPLNKNGWKLSHVFSANQNDYSFNYRSAVDELFPRGKYEDFKIHDGIEYPFRKIDDKVTDENVERIKAHFLRVVHPINYFLTPMVKYQSSTKGIKDIGEHPEMIALMKNKLKERYGTLFSEYLDMIMAPSDSSPIGLSYGMNVRK